MKDKIGPMIIFGGENSHINELVEGKCVVLHFH